MLSVERDSALRDRTAEAARSEGCDLLELKLRERGPSTRIEITVDRAEGVTVDDCARISRRLSREFEDDAPVDGSYVLEVSSPGLDRKLASSAEYDHFKGRAVVVELATEIDGMHRLRGTLDGFDPDANTAFVLDPQHGDRRALPLDKIAWTRLDLDAVAELKAVKP